MLSRLYPFIKNSHIVSSLEMMTSSTQIANKVTSPIPHNCSYRISAGTFKTFKEKVVPSVTNETSQTVQSDMRGKHKVCITQACREPQCHKRFCDSIHAPICPHKLGSPELVAEMAGALTHKVPKDKQRVLLEINDADGKNKPQFMVKEKTAIPVEKQEIKINEKITEYVQQEPIASIVRDNLADNSVISLKNTSLNDTPIDENL